LLPPLSFLFTHCAIKRKENNCKIKVKYAKFYWMPTVLSYPESRIIETLSDNLRYRHDRKQVIFENYIPYDIDL